MARSRWREWTFAVLLFAPALLPIAAHYITTGDDARIPTGFIQYDQPYYMANARQYLDGATDGLRYGLPFSAERSPDPIYFQPQTSLLALLWWLTGLDPGIVLNLFGLLFGVLCVRAIIRVLHEAVPGSAGKWWLDVLFLWGGGLLFLLGLRYGLHVGEGFERSWLGGFRFDPANGYWFMNLGRNLVFPLEAYYHFLFFTLILLVLRRRFAWGLVVCAVLSLSHPFTGIETLLILLGWCVITAWSPIENRPPRWFAAGVIALFVFHVILHKWLMARNPEHAILMAQWAQPWGVEWKTTFAAYMLVAAPALWRLLKAIASSDLRPAPLTALLLAWIFVCLGLEHHDLIMTAVQPAHFTRGYAWAGLFLLAAPVILRWSERIRNSLFRWPIIVAVVLILLLDNTLWLTRRASEFHRGGGEAINLTPDMQATLAHLKEIPAGGPLLVSNDEMLSYLALVYTPHRAYYSHRFNTPWMDQRYAALNDFFHGRITDPLLEQDLLIVVYDHAQPVVMAQTDEQLYHNGSYTIWARKAVR